MILDCIKTLPWAALEIEQTDYQFVGGVAPKISRRLNGRVVDKHGNTLFEVSNIDMAVFVVSAVNDWAGAPDPEEGDKLPIEIFKEYLDRYDFSKSLPVYRSLMRDYKKHDGISPKVYLDGVLAGTIKARWIGETRLSELRSILGW